MSSIEEILWNYIDGNCTTEEQKAISTLIAQDEAYRLKYQELLALNAEFATIELDEPPMAFTYNVLEAIRTEHAQQPLKAAINKKIILGITIFFVTTITALLVYTLSTMSWPVTTGPIQVPAGLKMPDVSHLISKPVIQGFLFFDAILAMFLFDTYLRRRRTAAGV
jgi:hypothetical protein